MEAIEEFAATLVAALVTMPEDAGTPVVQSKAEAERRKQESERQGRACASWSAPVDFKYVSKVCWCPGCSKPIHADCGYSVGTARVACLACLVAKADLQVRAIVTCLKCAPGSRQEMAQ